MTAKIPKLIVSDPKCEYDRPCFSEDGASIVFMRRERASKNSLWHLCIIDANPPHASHVILDLSKEGISCLCPDWCFTQMNQTQQKNICIAFTADKNGESSIWLSDLHGKAQELKVDFESKRVSYPSWMPGGTAVLANDCDKHRLVLLDLNGKSTALTDPAVILAGPGSASPTDWAKICFAGQKPENSGFVDAKNGLWMQTDKQAPVLLDAQHSHAPAWAPDGSWVAFASDRASKTPGHYSVFVKKTDAKNDTTGSATNTVNTNTAMLITAPDWRAQHAKWSPDGRRLAFAAVSPQSAAGIGMVVIDSLL